ncbi:M14 family zinc carboxypeptidase [Shimazuella kribbensis]|uniref:M14 family zinc carboxypeptidase n=1 Tax=Shimazuella kribbensis TaxID=139808 RepID=UPI00041ABD99|nr:M14 family zinc carboxypeptidase [Shimazuella kribbensis]
MKKFSLLLILLLLIATPVYGNPQAVPNGPWLQDTQTMKLERLHNYEELVKELHQIEKSSQGKVQLEVIGKSNQNRNIYLAKVGTGKKKVMYVTQQHGNEPLGTEAALHLLKNLGSSNQPEVKKIRDEITLYVVVRANPDGAEKFWRHNYDPDATPEFGLKGEGYDMNRYHSPNMLPKNNPVPEAAAIRSAYDRYKPDIVVDYHHQGSYVSGDGDMITTSVFWPNHPNVASNPLNLSKQVSLVIYNTLMHYGFAKVSQYPGGTYEGIARNGYGLLGSGSVLVEFRGDIGQKSSGMLIRTAYAAMAGILEEVAEGTLKNYNPADADKIPLRGEGINNSEEGEN